MVTCVVRADASPAMGGGHLKRCLSLAAAFADAGWTCNFAVNPEARLVIPELASSGHSVLTVRGTDDGADMIGAHPGGVDLLIVDHYGLDARFERACRGWAQRILVIDDLANRAHDCDVLVDQTAGRQPSDYETLLPRGSRILTGTEFAILAPEYAMGRATSLGRRGGGNLDRIVVSFGLTDPCGATAAVVRALDRSSLKQVHLDVVAGSSVADMAGLQSACASSRHDVHLHRAPGSIADLLVNADLAIGAAGTTSWERSCLGVPSIVTALADNQAGNLAVLVAAGAAVSIGTFEQGAPERLIGELDRLVRSPELLRVMSRRAASLCDGLGARRVRSELLPPVAARDGVPVRLRAARSEDAGMMLAWQSEPGARVFSGDPRPPQPSSHFDWVERKLQDADCIFNIVMHGDEPAGILRYDRTAPGVWVVSILVAAAWQGRGIAGHALALGNRILAPDTVIARVHKENEASRRLFRGAGFQSRGPEEFIYMQGGHVACETARSHQGP